MRKKIYIALGLAAAVGVGYLVWKKRQNGDVTNGLGGTSGGTGDVPDKSYTKDSPQVGGHITLINEKQKQI